MIDFSCIEQIPLLSIQREIEQQNRGHKLKIITEHQRIIFDEKPDFLGSVRASVSEPGTFPAERHSVRLSGAEDLPTFSSRVSVFIEKGERIEIKEMAEDFISFDQVNI